MQNKLAWAGLVGLALAPFMQPTTARAQYATTPFKTTTPSSTILRTNTPQIVTPGSVKFTTVTPHNPTNAGPSSGTFFPAAPGFSASRTSPNVVTPSNDDGSVTQQAPQPPPNATNDIPVTPIGPSDQGASQGYPFGGQSPQDFQIVAPAIQNFQSVAPGGATANNALQPNNVIVNYAPPLAPRPPIQWFPSPAMLAQGLNSFDTSRERLIQAGNLVNIYQSVDPKELPQVLFAINTDFRAAANSIELTSSLQRRGLIFDSQHVVGAVNDRIYVLDTRVR